jgi:hypothetical protein
VIQQGSIVRVIKSPYDCVKVGTVDTVTRVEYEHFSKGKHPSKNLYVLGKLRCTSFRRSEIEEWAE